MRNIRLKIEYDGTHYNGWQAQKKGKFPLKHQITIQQAIETVLSRILQEDIKLTGSGRTDSGVHALGQIANFKTISKMPASRIQYALNGLLPKDIVIAGVKETDLAFHSRFDAVSKTYRYRILNRPYPSAVSRLYQHYVPSKLGLDAMQKASRALIGRKDFRSFQASDKKNRSSVRNIKRLSVKRRGSEIIIDIEADGFLYNMVRNIVGTLIQIGHGKFSPEKIKQVLCARDRKKAGPTAPAKGLCLMEVRY